MLRLTKHLLPLIVAGDLLFMAYTLSVCVTCTTQGRSPESEDSGSGSESSLSPWSEWFPPALRVCLQLLEPLVLVVALLAEVDEVVLCAAADHVLV